MGALASEARMRVRIIGPGRSGFLKIELLPISERGSSRVIDVAASNISPDLHPPNSLFVAAVRRGEFLRVEEHGELWLDIQEKIRTVLNSSWDPIRVAGVVDDEYEHYIGPLYELLITHVPDADIADHLRTIETEWMGLRPSTDEKISNVIAELRGLHLPSLPV